MAPLNLIELSVMTVHADSLQLFLLLLTKSLGIFLRSHTPDSSPWRTLACTFIYAQQYTDSTGMFMTDYQLADYFCGNNRRGISPPPTTNLHSLHKEFNILPLHISNFSLPFFSTPPLCHILYFIIHTDISDKGTSKLLKSILCLSSSHHSLVTHTDKSFDYFVLALVFLIPHILLCTKSSETKAHQSHH